MVGGPMGIQFPFARVEYCDDAKTEVFREITNKNNVVVALQNCDIKKLEEVMNSAGYATSTKKTVPKPSLIQIGIDLDKIQTTIAPRLTYTLVTKSFDLWYKAFSEHLHTTKFGTKDGDEKFDVGQTRNQIAKSWKVYRGVKNPFAVLVSVTDVNVALFKALQENDGFLMATMALQKSGTTRIFVEQNIPAPPVVLKINSYGVVVGAEVDYVKPTSSVVCSIEGCTKWTFGQQSDKCKAHSNVVDSKGARGQWASTAQAPAVQTHNKVTGMPEIVRLLFDGNPIEYNEQKFFGLLADDFIALVGGTPTMSRAGFRGSISTLTASFPDLTFNAFKVGSLKSKVIPDQHDEGIWSAIVNISGTHLRKPYSAKSFLLPNINATGINVNLQARISVIVSANGKASKMYIDPVADEDCNLPLSTYFYLKIGGSMTTQQNGLDGRPLAPVLLAPVEEVGRLQEEVNAETKISAE